MAPISLDLTDIVSCVFAAERTTLQGDQGVMPRPNSRASGTSSCFD